MPFFFSYTVFRKHGDEKNPAYPFFLKPDLSLTGRMRYVSCRDLSTSLQVGVQNLHELLALFLVSCICICSLVPLLSFPAFGLQASKAISATYDGYRNVCRPSEADLHPANRRGVLKMLAQRAASNKLLWSYKEQEGWLPVNYERRCRVHRLGEARLDAGLSAGHKNTPMPKETGNDICGGS